MVKYGIDIKMAKFSSSGFPLSGFITRADGFLTMYGFSQTSANTRHHLKEFSTSRIMIFSPIFPTEFCLTVFSAIANARREHKRTALLSLNLDNFIPISNKYGLDIWRSAFERSVHSTVKLCAARL